MSVASKLMTTEELLGLPDNGSYRELIRGELREYPMTTRGRPHCVAMTKLAFLLESWLEGQPSPRGSVLTGDARVRLRRNPDTFVGADLTYSSPEQVARTDPNAAFIDEPPVLVVEILSPSDTIEDVADKVREYLEAGVALVWEVNPFYQSVTVHRPGAPLTVFSADQDLTAEPYLPGFRAPVAKVFEV
jgi:Uma2 family endonuclease